MLCLHCYDTFYESCMFFVFLSAPNSGGGGGIVPALAAAQTGDLGPILGNTGGRPGLGGPGGAGGPVPGSKYYSGLVWIIPRCSLSPGCS